MHKADQEQNISGYARAINTVSSPETFNTDVEKCRDRELSVTSGPDTGDYRRRPAAGFGRLQGDSAVLPSDHTELAKRFPMPSLEMTFLFQGLRPQNETTNGSVSISSREGPAFSAVT